MGVTDTPSAALAINKARVPRDLFGDLSGNSSQQLAQAKMLYLRLAKLIHPDSNNGDRAESTRLFSRLADLWEQTQSLIATGSYDDGGLTGLVVRTKRGVEYTIGGRIANGDISDVHVCGDGWIKVSRHPRNNDLLRAEAANLKTVRGTTSDKYLVYLPDLVDSFRIKDATNHERVANVFSPLHVGTPEHQNKWVSLSDIHRIIPALKERDAAWMWRRLLTAISLAHDAGYVHHAVLPEHVMILPPEHGVVLIDWCYSRPVGASPVALIPSYRKWYPEEVIAKEPSRTETDIAMAAQTIVMSLGGSIEDFLPKTVQPSIRAHLRACTLPKASMRPGNAKQILDSFDEIIWRLWGKRLFHEFVVPTT